MAYRYDPYDNALVIDGWENGIADSPHAGLSDMRNVNIISVPGEASVNFATSQITNPPISQGTVVSADASADTITFTGALSPDIEARMAIVFSGASLPTGITAGTIYWVGNVSLVVNPKTFKVYSDPGLNNLIDITATGTGTFTVFTPTKPKYFTYDSLNGNTWMVDSSGQVWFNGFTTGVSNYWVFTGNKVNNNSNGNGIVFYQASDGTNSPVGYIFVFSNSSIDYTPSATGSISWTYQWNPATGTAAGYSATPSKVLKTLLGVNNSHMAICAPDNRVYFCDYNWIGRWYQTSATTAFDPTSTATYTFDQTALLPTTDNAQCLAFLGTSILIGGKNNIIYPWDRFDTNFSYPILIAENNIVNMVTVNTNTFIFVGNRGRIYVTNGTNAALYKKIPDHISGTVEPYFTWGGASYVKNQLYFSASVTSNSGTSIPQYGGLWAIDLDTQAIRLVNKLSYGTYAGYASAIIPNYGTNPAGTGLFIGWDSGNSTYGVDTTISTPYTGSQATIDSDLIPIGTYNKAKDVTKVEYKLTKPLVNGESIVIKTRLIFDTSDTGYATTLSDSTVGAYSGTDDINFKNAQWAQFQIILNSTASSPSYTRLKYIRILGLNGSLPT